MSASRQLRAITTSYRALSARNVTQRCASPVRPSFLGSQQQSARFVVSGPVSPLQSQSRAFSGSALARDEGASDTSLSQRLQEEIKYEKESTSEEAPEFLQAFKAEKIWNIEEVPGSDEVTLQRTFGNEKIRVMFSIADIDTSSEQHALDPEDEEGGETEEDEVTPSYPIRTSITITKPNGARGALSIDAVCQDGVFSLDNIAYYPDAKIATELTPEADWKRRGLYIGPQFDHLDVNVQEEFEKFLRERGIAEGLALFIPEYAEHKEQKEYVKWLESVKEFVDV